MGRLFEQQEKESAKAFAAFSVYLNMGAERSLEAVAQKVTKSSRLIKKWSSRWRWGERVDAHAAHLATVEREASEVLVRGLAAERVKRQQALLEEEWAVHEECIRAGREALKRFYEKGKGATLGDIARMFAEGSRLGRLATGLATDKTEVTGEDGGAIRVEFEAALKKVYGVRDGETLKAEIVDVEEIGKRKAESRNEGQSLLTSAATDGLSPDAAARQGGKARGEHPTSNIERRTSNGEGRG